MKGLRQRVSVTILVVALLVVSMGIWSTVQAETATYAQIYSQTNPVPGIAARVRPAIVQVHAMIETWSREMGKGAAEVGYGTGVYVDERGYIVTNYHVVAGADFINVETMDGQVIPVGAVLSDESVDLAVLRLETLPEGMAPVEWGDSGALVLGELVIAIGNPATQTKAYPGTVTAGIVSGLSIENSEAGNFTRYVPLIQTDAHINSGSSGGALLNAQGELVGITTLKIAEDEGSLYEGMGYAIPAALVKKVAGDLIEYGAVRRPRMGVMVIGVEGPETALKDYPPAGLLVSEIEEDGPAAQAGVRQYDVITAANGVRVHDFIELTAVLDMLEAGDVLRVTVYHCYDVETGYMIENPEYYDFDVALDVLD